MDRIVMPKALVFVLKLQKHLTESNVPVDHLSAQKLLRSAVRTPTCQIVPVSRVYGGGEGLGGCLCGGEELSTKQPPAPSISDLLRQGLVLLRADSVALVWGGLCFSSTSKGRDAICRRTFPLKHWCCAMSRKYMLSQKNYSGINMAKASFSAYALLKKCLKLQKESALLGQKKHDQFWSSFLFLPFSLFCLKMAKICLFCLSKRQKGRKRGLRHKYLCSGDPWLARHSRRSL